MTTAFADNDKFACSTLLFLLCRECLRPRRSLSIAAAVAAASCGAIISPLAAGPGVRVRLFLCFRRDAELVGADWTLALVAVAEWVAF